MNFFGIQNFNGFQAKNMVLYSIAGFPASPALGQIFYKTDTEKAYIYLAAGWKELEGVIYYGV